MDYLRYVIETCQQAPLPLVIALAFTTIVGAALLVRIQFQGSHLHCADN